MSKSERTRQFIIEKTAPIFNKYGFEGTSLSVLQDVTGLTKGSLYGNFNDKEEIAKEVFLYSMKKVRSFVGARLDKHKTARLKLTALLNFYSRYVFEPPIAGGCPLLNSAVEADDNHTFLKKTVQEEIERTIQFIASLLEEGKRNGEFSKDVKSMELATIFFTTIEGAIMVSRVSASDAAMKTVVKHCRSIIESIST
jgi:TetR/AcrR family transcriptional regulator, transcriptional repressor for nem operon